MNDTLIETETGIRGERREIAGAVVPETALAIEIFKNVRAVGVNLGKCVSGPYVICKPLVRLHDTMSSLAGALGFFCVESGLFAHDANILQRFTQV